MQAVQNTTSYVNNSSQTTQTQQTSKSSLFQSLLHKQTAPEDITFEEYKKLSEEDLETLFQNNEEALQDANRLKHTSGWTDDDTFNSIIFNIYLDDINNGTNNGKSYFHTQMLTTRTFEGKFFDPNNPDEADQPDTNMKKANEMLEFLANIEENIQTYGDKEWFRSTDVDKVKEIAKYIVEQYNDKMGETNSLLNSYTKTNSTSPTNSSNKNPSIEVTSSQATTKNEKLFKTILEDNAITYEEIEELSYEEIIELTNYYMSKDEDGEFIPNPRINVERKAGMLLSSTVMSQNENFNKAIFHSIRQIEDEKFLETFMYDITGTTLSDKIIAYPELQEEKFKDGIDKFITETLAKYEAKLDIAENDEEKEQYEALIGIFTKLDHMKKSFNNESIHEQKDNFIERMRALVDDIISVIKTGFSLEELEYIEKLLNEIKKRIRESRESGIDAEEDINKMIKELERAVAELQKRFTGMATIEAETDSLQDAEKADLSTDGLNFEARIDALEKSIEQMRSGQLIEIEVDTDKSEEEKEKEKQW